MLGGTPLDAVVAIETPEHVVFRHPVAGPLRRALAHVVDLIGCYGVVFIVALFAIGADRFSGASAGFGTGFLLFVLFLAQWVYFAAWEAWRGTTPGKMALGLRVVTTTGRPITAWAAILRNLLRAADVLPVGYVVGVVSMVATDRFQRLGDLVADTMVVATPRATDVEVPRLSPDVTPRERGELDRARNLSLDAEERAAIELFLVRRRTLGPEREEELALMISKPLQRRLGLKIKDPARLLALVHARVTGRDEKAARRR